MVIANKNKKIQIAAQGIFIKLRKLIFNGELKPGERITERALSNRLRSSRTPIRQALVWADASGLVVVHPNRGAYVRAYSYKDIIEIYDIWALMEGHAAYLATMKINPRDLKFLETETNAMRFIFEMTSAEKMEKALHFMTHNQKYHNKILEMADNKRLLELAKKEDNALLEMRATQWFDEEDCRTAILFHNKIVKAMTMHEAVRAKNLMREHIYTAREACLSHISETDVI